MIYGQIQYYKDEVTTWLRVVDFHNGELDELLRQVNVVLNFPVISIPDSKTGNSLVDRLMVQEQQFDHLRSHFEYQAQRLARAIALPDRLDSSIVELQTTFRTKMKTHELAFIKTKYSCSVFLSDFFEPCELPLVS